MFFKSPINLNGSELIAELKAEGIEIERVLLEGNNELNLDVNQKDKVKAEAIIKAHNGTMIAPDKSVERQAILDRIGLTSDELKTILG